MRLSSLSRAAVPALAVTTAAALVAGGVGFTANADDDTTTIQAAERGKNGSSGGFDLPKQLTKRVKAEAIGEHLDKLQEIADKFDGNRASGTPGYNASTRYIVRTLKRAGYSPEVQAFDFPFYVENTPAELEQTSPDATAYSSPDDFSSMTYSGSGDVTAAVVAVDTDGTANAASTSGCEAEDFTGFPEGSIALIQRGSCAFGQKALNAQEAGAAGVIVFNAGVEGRTDSFAGTLGNPGYDIPVVGTSFAVGQDLIDPAGTEVRLFADTTSEIRETYNVFAETRGGDKDNVVMAGSHLDSVVAGPGNNDNGSGSASILETAVKLAKFDAKDKKKGKKAKGNGGKGRLTNQVRFAWWGAEELGLLGSEHYVENLSQEEIDQIALYLNFDMVGSPNYVRFVYDGDNSEGGGAVGPAGSDDIEEMFNGYFDSVGLASEATPFSGRSDYGPFIVEGVDIPSGGLFTGAEGVKTEEQAQIYGGTAGEAYDPCYHQECDDRDNISMDAIDEMSGAIAFAVATYAVSTEGLGENSEPAPRLSRAERKAAEEAAHNAELHPAHDHSHGLRR